MKLTPKFTTLSPLALADILFRKDKRTELFLQLAEDRQLEMLRTLPRRVKKDIILHIPDSSLVSILEAVDPDEATDLLQLIGKNKRTKILQLLSQNVKDSLSTLLEFDPETAAGLMTLDYIQADITNDITGIADKFKQHERRTGRPPVILVMKDGQLAGFLPGHELAFASSGEPLEKRVKRIPSISYAASHDKVVQLFRSHPHGKVAVLSDSGGIIGIIYSDDVLKLIEEHRSSSLYDFAGISDEENVTDPARRKVLNRYRWLMVNVATAFLAAFTVSQFEDVLSKFVLLAVYMPIVAGMGGNASTQTLAVLVRGIALKQIELRTAWKTLKNELKAAAANGVIIGTLVALVALFISHDARIAVVLAVAMVANLLVAAFFGTLVPLIMHRLGKDPATSAAIFITTATDVLGFMTFLGLASIVLE